MVETLQISPDLKARIDLVAARSSRSAAEVVAEALEQGHSLAWQERFIEQVALGMAAADEGDFATPAQVEQVLGKYRPR